MTAARVFQSVPRVAAWLAIALGAMVLVGWALDASPMRTVFPGSVAMKANTAAALMLAGAALGLSRRSGGRVAAAAVLLIGVTTMSEFITGWNLHVDQLLFSDSESPFRAPGRMAFTTAASLVVLGAALLLATSKKSGARRIAEILAGIAGLFVLFEIEGHALGATPPAGYSPMALPTALALAMLCIGTIAAVPDSWLTARATDPGPGGILTRRLLPVAIGLPLALGVLGKAGEAAGWLDALGNIWLMVMLTMLLLIATAVWSVAAVERVGRALRDAEELFRSFFEESPIGILIMGLDGKLLRANPAVTAILGYSPAELRSLSWMDITHPDDLAPSREAVRVLSSRQADRCELEKRYRAKDGRWVWARNTISVHRGADGATIHFLAHIQDIGESKRAVQVLAASESYHRALIEEALDLTTLVDADGFVSYASPSYQRVLGYQPEHVIGQRVFDFVHPDDLAATLAIFTDGSSTPEATRAHEFRFRHHDGSWRVIAAVGRNLFDDPVIHAAIINGRDVTEQKRTEEHERTLLRELQASVAEVKVLTGILPICASCKRIKKEDGGWEAVESYVRDHTNAEFSHGICPDCAAREWGRVPG